jgi:hypothetical protein
MEMAQGYVGKERRIEVRVGLVGSKGRKEVRAILGPLKTDNNWCFSACCSTTNPHNTPNQT